MAGPTNRQIAIAHVDADTEQTIRDACTAQGCTCGDRLAITIRPLDDDERPVGAEGAGKASEALIEHSSECPMLARQQGRN